MITGGKQKGTEIKRAQTNTSSNRKVFQPKDEFLIVVMRLRLGMLNTFSVGCSSLGETTLTVTKTTM